MTPEPQSYLQIVQSLYQENGNPETAAQQAAYMRHQFEFYGLKAVEWMPLAKDLFKKYGIYEGEGLKQFARLCFQDDHREVHYFAVEMVQKALKQEPAGFIDFLEDLITTRSWWDTVDWLSKLVGIHFKKHPDLIRPVTGRWMESGNIWLQRTCLIFQLLYHEQTDSKLLFEYILRLKSSREFFIQKGAGWALRQYSKINAKEVVRFVEQNDLPPLTKREGLKWLRARKPGK